MFNDEQIADENSMSKLSNVYASMTPKILQKTKVCAVSDSVDVDVWTLFRDIDELLNFLTQHMQNKRYKEYLFNLKSQNQEELANLIALYPQLDKSKSNNPIFSKLSKNILCAIKKYLLKELELVNQLFLLYKQDDNSQNKESLFTFIVRHFDNLKKLIEESNI